MLIEGSPDSIKRYRRAWRDVGKPVAEAKALETLA